MAGYALPLRNAQLDAITTFAGPGAKLRVYGGAQPATGGAAGTLLVELPLGSPFAPAASGGILSPSLSSSVNAVASGTATWFRIVKADGTTFVLDGTIGVSGSNADLIINSTAVSTGLAFVINAFSFVRGNA